MVFCRGSVARAVPQSVKYAIRLMQDENCKPSFCVKTTIWRSGRVIYYVPVTIPDCAYVTLAHELTGS